MKLDASQTGKRPLIQEISSSTVTKAEEPKIKNEKKESEEVEKPFEWDRARQVEASYTFLDQGELVFVTFNFKGYKKESDVRYALSENEMVLEVRDVGKNTVHRVCKTLQFPIVSKDSSVQLLIDYIVFKLKKDHAKAGGVKKWD